MNEMRSAGRHASYWLVMAGLAGIVALLFYPIPTTWTAVISVPLLLLLVLGVRPPRKWGGWVAAMLIPYFAGALGEALASPDARTINWAITALTITTFLAAFILVRRTGVNLRR